MNIIIRKAIGILAKPFSPGYSCCSHCGRTWNICKSHVTMISSSDGCFPLCEQCWGELTPEERLPHYKALYREWLAYGYLDDGGQPWEETWRQMKTAVMNGG